MNSDDKKSVLTDLIGMTLVLGILSIFCITGYYINDNENRYNCEEVKVE